MYLMLAVAQPAHQHRLQLSAIQNLNACEMQGGLASTY